MGIQKTLPDSTLWEHKGRIHCRCHGLYGQPVSPPGAPPGTSVEGVRCARIVSSDFVAFWASTLMGLGDATSVHARIAWQSVPA
jgi:hypothetical protein